MTVLQIPEKNVFPTMYKLLQKIENLNSMTYIIISSLHHYYFIMVWIIGRGIYALNYIQFINNDTIYLITTDKYDFARFSNKIKMSYFVKFDDNYCKNVIRLVGADFAIAIGEETLFFDEFSLRFEKYMKYARHHTSEFLHDVNLYGISSRCERIMYHNKYNFMNLVKKLNLPYIKTWNTGQIINTPCDILLKPIYGRGGKGHIFKHINKTYISEITEITDQFIVPENYIAQKFIKNKADYSTFAIVSNGNITQYVAYQCMDMIDGFSTERIIVKSSKLYNYTSKIVSHIYYTGFIGLDFIKCPITGNYYVVDFNPRITNGISLLNKSQTISISTIPYLLKSFTIDRLKKSIKYSDVVSIRNMLPFIVMIFTLIFNVIVALFMRKSPSEFIKKNIEKSIIKFDKEKYNQIYWDELIKKLN